MPKLNCVWGSTWCFLYIPVECEVGVPVVLIPRLSSAHVAQGKPHCQGLCLLHFDLSQKVEFRYIKNVKWSETANTLNPAVTCVAAADCLPKAADVDLKVQSCLRNLKEFMIYNVKFSLLGAIIKVWLNNCTENKVISQGKPFLCMQSMSKTKNWNTFIHA